ncbi:MAG: NlpC/P60 family protein [Chitinophagales bacterium]|nr:NlpC/P60 family protein [Chitinophagales bacterium]
MISIFCTFWVSGSFFAKDINLCSLEAASYDYDIDYQNLVTFLGEEKIDIESSAFPDVYAFAYSWLHTPYRYGGDSKNGIDCSRFVMKLFNQVLGLNTVGTSAELSRMGQTVDKSQLKEGDLVFFTTRGKSISHVGIYLQNNKFVHSSTSKGVIVSSLDEPYWKRTYAKSTRFYEPHPF